MPESFTLTTPRGETIHGLLEIADLPGPRPTVVICHGFKGFQEWGFFPHLATLLAERGMTAIRFNFPGSGMLPGDSEVTDMEAFRTAAFSHELEDLSFVLEQVGKLAPERIDPDHLALLGHSRGGGTAILASALPQWRDRLRALVTWSAVSTFDRASAEEKAAWRQAGSMPIVNARTGQELSLGTGILDDLEANAERLDIAAAARRRVTPWLIIHGAEDATVPVEEAELLAGQARQPADLLTIPHAGHTFEVGHPFHRPSPEFITVLNATQTFLRRHLTSVG